MTAGPPAELPATLRGTQRCCCAPADQLALPPTCPPAGGPQRTARQHQHGRHCHLHRGAHHRHPQGGPAHQLRDVGQPRRAVGPAGALAALPGHLPEHLGLCQGGGLGGGLQGGPLLRLQACAALLEAAMHSGATCVCSIDVFDRIGTLPCESWTHALVMGMQGCSSACNAWTQ